MKTLASPRRGSMGIIVILICFAGSGALTIFLVALCRDDHKNRKCHVRRIEDLLGPADEWNLDRGSVAPFDIGEARKGISSVVPRRTTAGIGTGTSGAAD